VKKYACILTTLALACSASNAFADTISLTSALVNSSAAGVVDPTSPGAPGLTGTLDGATGLGTIMFTDTNTGAGFFNLFVDLSLAIPFYNEFGATAGILAAGQSWQIDVPDYWCSTPACQSLGLPFGSPDPNDPLANILANTLTGSLNDQNGVPGTLSNFLNDCGAEPNAISPAQNSLCNNDVALAMGFSYFIPAGHQELISLTVSQTAPASGFYLEQLHPVDAANPSGAAPVFLYGSAELQQVSSVPEPSTFLMTTSLVVILMFAGLRRRSTGISCKADWGQPGFRRMLLPKSGA
jgi:hypothetical protein